jgi:hypothetical protein
LHNIEICVICIGAHPTKKCPSLPEIKATYQGEHEEKNSLYAVAPQRPWQPQSTCMV